MLFFFGGAELSRYDKYHLAVDEKQRAYVLVCDTVF